jgi:putative N6-adenine-specific DNA methylase
MEAIPWELYLSPYSIPDFNITCHHSRLYHTGRITEECSAAIGSKMKKIYPHYESAAEQKDRFSQAIFVRLEDDLCTVSLDCSGDPLYRRGFRTKVAQAPLRETLAALILHEAHAWEFDAVIDPMCGSGVIPIEAALLSQGIMPGMRRSFSFEKWPGHPDRKYLFHEKICAEIIPVPFFKVYAGDSDPKAVETAQSNLDQSGLADFVSLSQKDFFTLLRTDFKEGKILIVTNPPYGTRIDAGDINTFYRRLGDKIRSDFGGCSFAVIVPKEAENVFGMKKARKILFQNGGIKVALITGLTQKNT